MSFSGKDLAMEVQKCLIPNCATVSWNILRQETIRYGMNKSIVVIEFDSGRKVSSNSIFQFQGFFFG